MAVPESLPAELHVWKVLLVQPPEVAAAFSKLLSPDETRRAEAFAFEQARERYVVAHGALRLILAGYGGGEDGASAASVGEAAEAAASLRFVRGAHGKPRLVPEGPQFNLSHCDDLALVAVVAGPEAGTTAVGVDVERLRTLSELGSIRERYFSAEEREHLDSAGRAAGTRPFLTLWARREAAAKALGLDLQAALARIRVPVYPPGASAAWPGLPEAAGQAGGGAAAAGGPWWLTDLPLDPQHVGAACLQGRPRALELHDFLPTKFL